MLRRLFEFGVNALGVFEIIPRRHIFPIMPCLTTCISAMTDLHLSVFFVEMPRCTLLILFLSSLKLATGSAFSVKKKEET